MTPLQLGAWASYTHRAERSKQVCHRNDTNSRRVTFRALAQASVAYLGPPTPLEAGVGYVIKSAVSASRSAARSAATEAFRTLQRRWQQLDGVDRKERLRVDLELINFSDPNETRQFEKGRFELYRVGPMTLGRATYEPGWRWSEHVAPSVGTASCQTEHVGLVLSGKAIAKMDDGTERLMTAGDFFYVPPGHDSWVVGDEPYVSLHILGSEDYAAASE